ncbi:MAG: flagellar basal-body MS-ring/collar protein FliF [Oscillospiraceae bacterium]|nr:flagellar basal-body MS-ring/collar protein FliF [Oscillospiraceae bacterium]
MGQVIEQIKKLWTSLKEYWANKDKKGRTRIVLGLILALALIILLVVFMNMTKYTILYSGLDSDEQTEVSNYLAENQIPYKVEGDTIKVDASREEAVRMELSNQGHPYSTPNYDFYFNNVGTLTTSEERKLIEEYQLNQRLADVIKTIDGVKSATVTIAYPNTSSYVLSNEDNDDLTAGVTVTLRGGKKLSETQVAGIQTLVSTSVPGLSMANVSVIDTATGEALSGANSSSGGATVSSATLDLKKDVENAYEEEIENKVLTFLNELYGSGNVRVSVNCSVNVDDSIKEIVTYIPSEDNRGVITSEDLANLRNNSGTGVTGQTGTDTNAEITENEDITTYPTVNTGNGTVYIQDEKSYDYLVSYVKEQVQKQSGVIDNLTVSVILNKESIADSKRQQLTELISNTAAVDATKVVIYTDLFNSNGSSTGYEDQKSILDQYPWLIFVLIGVAVVLLIIIILLIVLRKKKKKKKGAAPAEEATPMAEQSLTLDAEQMEELQDIKIAKGLVMKQKIQDFSQQNPEIAAQLVKGMLRGEDK